MLRAMWNGFNIIQRPALHTRFPAQWTALWALTKNCRSPSHCVEQVQTFFTFNVRGPNGSSVSRQVIQGIPTYPKASHPSRLSTIQKKYRITGHLGPYTKRTQNDARISQFPSAQLTCESKPWYTLYFTLKTLVLTNP